MNTFLKKLNEIKNVSFLFQSQAKFCLERAQEALDWLSAVTEHDLTYEEGGQLKDQAEFANLLKDGVLLCEYAFIFVLSYHKCTRGRGLNSFYL